MSTGLYPFTLTRGETLSFSVYVNGVNGSGSSASMVVADSTGAAVLTLTTPASGIVITNSTTDPNGVASALYAVTVTAAQNATLAAGAYSWDIRIVAASGAVSVPWGGSYTVKAVGPRS